MREDGSRYASTLLPYLIERQTGHEHPAHPEQEDKEESRDPFVLEPASPILMIKFSRMHAMKIRKMICVKKGKYYTALSPSEGESNA